MSLEIRQVIPMEKLFLSLLPIVQGMVCRVQWFRLFAAMRLTGQ